MDENVKLYVFARKEVYLIFLFMVLASLSSFYFGVKVGKSFSLQQQGITEADRKKVDLLSTEEEKVEKVVNEGTSLPDETKKQVVSKDSYELLKEKINQEFKDSGLENKSLKEAANKSAEAEKVAAPKAGASKVATPSDEKINISEAMDESKETTQDDKKIGTFYNETSRSGEKAVTLKYAGKYTIQLGSYQTKEEAEQFAEGFRLRGYTPVINEVSVATKGTWFRVNLGIFDTVLDAKDYILKERSLFQGQDYVIGKFE